MRLSTFMRRRQGSTTVFFGAGAGVADGLPSTAQLAHQVRDDIDYGGIHPTFLKVPSFTEFLYRGDATSLANLVTTAWQMRRQRHPVGILLYHVVTEAAARAVDTPAVGVDGHRRRLLSYLYRVDEPLYVLTTNWDTSLDTIASSIAGERGVDYGFRLDTHSEGTAMSASSSVNLYKLNGSPNWILCRECNALSTRLRTLRPDESVLDLVIGAPGYRCSQCYSFLERVMVLPSVGAAHNPLSFDELRIDPARVPMNTVRLLSLHSEAMKAVAESQHLFFIGYSLPDYDAAIRELLSEGLRRNTFVVDGFASVTVVAKGDLAMSTKHNFERLLGNAKVTFCGDGLDEFLRGRVA